MLIAVTDTETTGMEETDQVLELVVGFYDHDKNQDPVMSSEGYLEWLIRPTVPVHPAARGIHHITDAELADKPTLAEYLEKYPDPFYDLDDEYETVLCAHNAEFDVRLLMQSLVAAGHLDWRSDSILPNRTIDTWVCAKHLWPDAPGHGNQTLRYWLELDRLYPSMTDALRECGLPPHRALPDVIVTTHLLRRMLELRSPEELITLTGTPGAPGHLLHAQAQGQDLG